MVERLIERVAPASIGHDFRRLLGAVWLSNLGDGIALAAGPLLIAAQTKSPTLVAMATILQRLPWVVFGLAAGVAADRVNRRWLVQAAMGVRVVILAALSALVRADQANVGIVLGAMFLLGVAEVFTDVSTDSLIPTVVEPEHLGIANARIVFGHRTMNQLIGPPLGAMLFAASMAVPFLSQAMLLVAAIGSIAKMRVPDVARERPPVSIVADLRDGVRWLWSNGPVRTLTLTVFTFNLTFGATWSLLVLYSEQRLELGERGFGFLLASSAIGGVVGAAGYGWLERRFTLGNMMRAGLVLETLTHLGLAATTTPAIAMLVMVIFGAQASVWGTTSGAVRQRAVPAEMRGRVASVYKLGVFAGLVIGGLLGGAIASRVSVIATWWFAFVGSALILVLIWRELPNIAHAGTAGTDDNMSAGGNST